MDKKRQCSTCLIPKPIGCFGKHPKSKDGIRASCKACRVQDTMKRRQRKKDLELLMLNPPAPRKFTCVEILRPSTTKLHHVVSTFYEVDEAGNHRLVACGEPMDPACFCSANPLKQQE